MPIPKSGDLSIGGNYRGISLSSIVAKIYNMIILNRIHPEIDIEGVKEHQLPAIITFIDFCKAFDLIHRGKIAAYSQERCCIFSGPMGYQIC